jgi:two-component system, sensor histidine kinase and response regulator
MTSPRVLVVDDHEDTLQLLGASLFLDGFQVTLARNPNHALELAGTRFDAITTDVAMPGMDGFEFIRRVRHGGLHHGPIVVVTGQAVGTFPAELGTLGCCRLLTKPCDLTELASTIRCLVDTCVRDCGLCQGALAATLISQSPVR